MDVEKLKRVAMVVVPIVCVLGGTAIGWYAKPDVVRVEEKVRVETVEKQVVAIQERVRVETVYVKDVQVVDRWHREKTEEKKPDGTVTIREVEDRNIDSHTTEKKTDTEVKVVTVEKQVVVTQDVIKTVRIEPVLAQWHVGVLAGVAPRFDNLPETAIMVGVEAERRIAGPVWLGVAVLGGSPTTQFNVVNATVALKIGMEF